jgi:hypothetical protein
MNSSRSSGRSGEPAFHVGFFVMHPHRSRAAGRQILDLLISAGGIYVPEECEMWIEKERFQRKNFSSEIVDELLNEWEGHHGPLKGFNLLRSKPYQVQFNATLSDFSYFDTFGLDLETSYVKQGSKSDEVLGLTRKLYDLIAPAFGQLGTLSMLRKMKQGRFELLPGTDLLKQGLPDLEWAVFLGPEYVEMFGREKVLSVKCYHTELLGDGGALLVLTRSPLDFEKDPTEFNRARDSVRAQLGEDAFYIEDAARATRFPKFRSLERRDALVRESLQRWNAQKKRPGIGSTAQNSLAL